jgi:hypothetical protein
MTLVAISAAYPDIWIGLMFVACPDASRYKVAGARKPEFGMKGQ